MPGLTPVSLLESKSGFEIVNLLTPERDHLHIYSLWFEVSQALKPTIQGDFLHYPIFFDE
jgi:hypothetical protein